MPLPLQPPPSSSSSMMIAPAIISSDGPSSINNNINNNNYAASSGELQVMELTEASAMDQFKHSMALIELEAKQASTVVDVPTLPQDVKNSLRELGLPVRLFGENLANVRDRLRHVLATKQVLLQKQQQQQQQQAAPSTNFMLTDDMIAITIATIGNGESVANSSSSNSMFGTTSTMLQQQQQQLLLQQQGTQAAAMTSIEEEEENITKYTRAHPALIQAREQFTKFSLRRSKLRLQWERNLRKMAWDREWSRQNRSRDDDDNENDDDNPNDMSNNNKRKFSSFHLLEEIDTNCWDDYKSLAQITLEGSQYGDTRPLSCIGTTNLLHASSSLSIIATCSWSGTISLWNGSEPSTLDLVGQKTMAHEDRIMGMAIMNQNATDNTNVATNDNNGFYMATGSIDCSAKLWRVSEKEHHNNDYMTKKEQEQKEKEKEKEKEEQQSMDVEDNKNNNKDHDKKNNCNFLNLEEIHHFSKETEGHQARLCRLAFHPMGNYLGTTSYDHSWRLWDTVSGKQLLLQDGHYSPVFGIDFHCDGSLVSTTDFDGSVFLWDVRCGKSILQFRNVHAQRVLCAKFLGGYYAYKNHDTTPNSERTMTTTTNGFQLVTGGDDGTLKIWDLRKRKLFLSVPAHNRLISQISFGGNHSDEWIATSSFDGTAKLWSTRDWKMMNCLQGHQGGKVMGIAPIVTTSTSPSISSKLGVVTCGFDKTFKLWQ